MAGDCMLKKNLSYVKYCFKYRDVHKNFETKLNQTGSNTSDRSVLSTLVIIDYEYIIKF